MNNIQGNLPIKENQVSEQICRLSNLCDTLQQSVIRMLEKTDRIRMNYPKDVCKDSGIVNSPRVALAEELHCVCQRIESQIVVIDEAVTSMEI